jgi:phosphoglycerol transferase MdoB-like AlkP superfamily enzyme
MLKRMFSGIANSRYSLAGVIFVVGMLSFALTRTVLVLLSLDTAELSLFSLLQVYGIGFLYDAIFFTYALIPLAVVLLFVPNRLWCSRINRAVVHLLSFAAVYGLLFIVAAEILFWDEFQVRFNFISVDYLVYRREVTENISESYPLAWILSAMLVITMAIYWKMYPYINKALQHQDKLRHRGMTSLAMLLLPVISYTAVGQDMMQFSKNIYRNELSANGPYQFFAAFRNNELDYYRFYETIDDQIASSILRDEVKEPGSTFIGDELFNIKRVVHSDKPEKKLNIMLVMVESLSAKYMGVFGNEQQLTPNLDQLARQSLFFTRFFATGTRTTRGLEAVTLSIPPTPGRSIVKRLGRESGMWSLGNVMKSKGYDVRFLYGGRGYFDNMNAFFSGNGYGVIDQSTVPEEEIGFENAWGMADEYLYGQALKAADTAYQKKQPFFFHLMTTSNHRPYTYPDNRVDIPSGDGRDGAVKYTDWAIGDLIAQARTRPWFNDTVFVIVADHTASSAGKTALPVNKYHIPLLIYAPAHFQPERIGKIASQIDIAPTLLAMLNMEYESNFFGRNIFSMTAENERALIGNYQNLGLYTAGRMSVISPRHKLTQQIDPESGQPLITVVGTDDPQMRRDIAYYQGASYIYEHHMNAWDGSVN